MYNALFAAELFRHAAAYRALLQPATAAVREDADWVFPYAERHLRCVWYDPAYRPVRLQTAAGEPVVVEQAGQWNLEAGPDFQDAVLRVGAEARRLTGDVEIHIQPQDWRQHQHRDDPRYRRVVAHVTYFPGTVADGELPPGAVQIALRDALRDTPGFSFETLDLTAYPFAVAERHPPCAARIADWPPERRGALLDAAGEERLRRKAERMAAAIRDKGAAQAVYEDYLGALGYKNNRAPFRLLAGRVRLDDLRTESRGDPLRAYALLAGVAGLLPARLAPAWDEETRAFVRSLWDVWWKLRARWSIAMLARRDWSLTGLRPQNHPLRRLMAAAAAFGGPVSLLETEPAAPDADPRAWVAEWLRRLQTAGRGGYWSYREGFAGQRRAAPAALIGKGRAAAIFNNVIVPWLAARGRLETPTSALWRILPPEDENSAVRRMAFALFGHDHNPALYRTGLRQQGLVQMFHDFCLNARAGCQDCALPAALARE